MTEQVFKIPLRKTVLPKLEETSKYLREIDKSAIYSNNGPLVKKLEKRLSQHFKVRQERIVAVANCTQA